MVKQISMLKAIKSLNLKAKELAKKATPAGYDKLCDKTEHHVIVDNFQTQKCNVIINVQLQNLILTYGEDAVNEVFSKRLKTKRKVA